MYEGKNDYDTRCGRDRRRRLIKLIARRAPPPRPEGPSPPERSDTQPAAVRRPQPSGLSPVKPHTEGVSQAASIIKNIYKHYKIKLNSSHSSAVRGQEGKRGKSPSCRRFQGEAMWLEAAGKGSSITAKGWGTEALDDRPEVRKLDFSNHLWYPVPRPRSHPRDGSQG